VPFQAGIAAGADAVMMAHVIYPQVAPEPAGYSPRWIQDILRGELGFRGVVFSDDIGMAASHGRRRAGRVHAHLDAGCDVVLVCHPNWSMKPCTRCGAVPSIPLRCWPDRPRRDGWDGLLADPPWRHPSKSA
jgi:beta-N-acetylhexosaminidase